MGESGEQPFFRNPPRSEPQDGRSNAFVEGLRWARIVSKRDPGTGRRLDGTEPTPGEASNWPAAMVYMALLELIGACVHGRGGRTSFYRVLQTFGGLDELESKALYALRCSFMHSFSLVNQGEGKDKEELSHAFVVYAGRLDGRVVELPQTRWNGLKDKDQSHRTRVNLLAFEELAEKICRDIVERSAGNRIALELDQKALDAKYLIAKRQKMQKPRSATDSSFNGTDFSLGQTGDS